MKEIRLLIPSIYKKFTKLINSEKVSVFIPQVTENEEYYLDIIYYLNNPTFTEFAEKAKITKPAATQIVRKLMEKNYVKKIQCKKDKRVYYIEINDRIKKCFEKSDIYLNERYKKCLSCLSKDEREDLKNILSKIDKAL